MPDNKYWIVPLLGLGVLSLCVGDDQEHSNEFEYAYKHAVKADQCNERSTDCLNNINPCYKHGQAANIVDGSRPYPHGQAPNVVDGSRPTLQMVEIPGGKFIMGNNNSRFRNERDIPARWVEINTFYMDVYAVSNAEFEVFVNANNYKTEAEKLGESIVDEVDISEEIKSTIYEAFAEMTWWLPVKGADWKHPEGPDSSILDRMDHPVVHVSWSDAVAFCSWMGKRLPTEAEWERACKAGVHELIFYMGDQYLPNNQFRSNMWQGKFPTEFTGEEGCAGHCPVTSHSSNGYGLYNMLGNVWEWTADLFLESDYPGNHTNPGGVTFAELRVMKGEPRMCKQEIRYRYYCADRDGNTPDASSGDMGFRCAADYLPNYLSK